MTLILLCVTVSFTPRVPSAFALWLVVRQFTLLSACEVSEVCCSWVFPEEGGSSLPRRIPCRVDRSPILKAVPTARIPDYGSFVD